MEGILGIKISRYLDINFRFASGKLDMYENWTLTFQVLIQNFNCPRIFKNLKSLLIAIFHVLNNNLFYTQLVSSFFLQKNSYYSFFSFSSLANLWHLSGAFFHLLSFSYSEKRMISFTCFYWSFSLCFW